MESKKETPTIGEGSDNLFFNNNDLFNDIALTDGVNYFKPFVNLAKACMIPIEMGRITPAMANKKL